MPGKRLLLLLLGTAIVLGGMTAGARAFCGVIEESATAKTAQKATGHARKQVRSKVKALKQEHGDKLVLDPQKVACVGGAVAIDANGQQTEGNPNCTVTQPFCVNP